PPGGGAVPSRGGGRPRAAGRSAGSARRPAPGTWACAAASGSVPSWPMLLLLLPGAWGAAGTLRGLDQAGDGLPGREGKAEGGHEGPSFGVGAGGGADGDVHPPHGVDVVVVDLGEDELLGDAERVVAVPVERIGRQPPE